MSKTTKHQSNLFCWVISAAVIWNVIMSFLASEFLYFFMGFTSGVGFLFVVLTAVLVGQDGGEG